MYVDALISAGNHENEVFTLRITQKQYLRRADFYYTNGIQTIPGQKNVTLAKITQDYHMPNSNQEVSPAKQRFQGYTRIKQEILLK